MKHCYAPRIEAPSRPANCFYSVRRSATTCGDSDAGRLTDGLRSAMSMNTTSVSHVFKVRNQIAIWTRTNDRTRFSKTYIVTAESQHTNWPAPRSSNDVCTPHARTTRFAQNDAPYSSNAITELASATMCAAPVEPWVSTLLLEL